MTKNFSLPRGTADICPRDIFLWQELEAEARRLFYQYNFKEIRTPHFEETELFARSMGKTSDVVSKQMLGLTSQSTQGSKPWDQACLLSLRPENTASVVRSYIENHIHRTERLTKYFYIGAMFRGERPQKGRLRQFHQMGVEVLGEDAASAFTDAEVIALSVSLLKSFGLNGFELKINTLGSVEDKAKFSHFLREQLKPYLSELSEDSQKRFERNVLRILDSKDQRDIKVLSKIEIGGYNHLSEESRHYFNQVKKSLDSLGVNYMESPNLVRGLDYYTHTVFEISDASLGSQDALGAGGRYDTLVSQLGGPEVPAIGFALGMERILLALPEDRKVEIPGPDVFLIVLDQTAMSKAFVLLDQIRQQGVSADMSYRVSSMKSQMRLANKIGAKHVAILGDEEMAKGILTLKNMASGEQQEVKQEDIRQIGTCLSNNIIE